MSEPACARRCSTLAGVNTHIGPYHILQGVDLAVPRGALTMLLGRNGAGKTTTLRTIMGLWHASAGSVRFDGADITGVGDARHRPGRHRLRAREHGHLLRSHGARKSPAGGALRADRRGAARAGSSACSRRWRNSGRWPPACSPAGRSRCCAIARAIIEPRKLFLIDEPTKGLAPAIIANMIAAFRELKKRRDTTILVVEQNFLFAKSLGDAVAVMDNGRIVHAGAMAELADDRGAAAAAARPAAWISTNESGAAPSFCRCASATSCRSLLVPVVALAALPLVGSFSTWVTLTLAGLAMGMIIFIIASGLTLVFGLMDVLNFGHGAFISIGAYAAAGAGAVARRC